MHKVFNFKTLIFVVLVAAFVALMIAQQSLLDRNIKKNASQCVCDAQKIMQTALIK